MLMFVLSSDNPLVNSDITRTFSDYNAGIENRSVDPESVFWNMNISGSSIFS